MHRHICLFDCILFFPCNCFTLRKNRFRGSGSPFRVGVGCHSQSFTNTEKKLPFQIYHVHIYHPSLRTKNLEELDSWNFNSKRSDVRQESLDKTYLTHVCIHSLLTHAETLINWTCSSSMEPNEHSNGEINAFVICEFIFERKLFSDSNESTIQV